jgi:rRNA biogenesis protein RRP5
VPHCKRRSADIGVDSTNDTKGDHTKKPSTKEKNARKRLRAGSKADHERAIRDAERRRFEGDAAPTSAVEFEQLVLASPNSSYVWIKYIAFLISMGDIDGARKVAEKAISTIHYREESEKLNIWVAWLNAENLYGTEETTAQVLGKALTHADGRKLYLAAVDIFDRTDKTALAEQCLKAMCRKYGAAPDVWIRAIRYRLAHDDSDAARRTLDRALQSLPKHEHVGVASQAALLEFKLGDPERGRSMFEGILANYPRRLDLWSVYLDQEILQGDQQRIRALFERATHLALPPKKMKFLFKRYLEYERAHGDDSSVEHVKHKAMEFVERAMGQ